MPKPDSPILPLILSYQGYVARAIQYFRQMGVQGNVLRAWRRSSIPAWTDECVDTDPVIPSRGFLDADHTISYRFHGIGCCVEFGVIIVDFDFGPKGRWDGFDAWRLHLFAESVPEFRQFSDIDSVQRHLNDLVAANQIRQYDGVIGSHLYFFRDRHNGNCITE